MDNIQLVYTDLISQCQTRNMCRDIPRTVCTRDPVNTNKKISKPVCKEVPTQICNKVPRQVTREYPQTVSRRVCKPIIESARYHNNHKQSSISSNHSNYSNFTISPNSSKSSHSNYLGNNFCAFHSNNPHNCKDTSKFKHFNSNFKSFLSYPSYSVYPSDLNNNNPHHQYSTNPSQSSSSFFDSAHTVASHGAFNSFNSHHPPTLHQKSGVTSKAYNLPDSKLKKFSLSTGVGIAPSDNGGLGYSYSTPAL